MLMPFLQAHAPTAGVPTVSEEMLWAILVAPLVAWALIAAYGRKFPTVAGWLAMAGVGVACLLSYITLFNVMDADGGIRQYTHEWLPLAS
jgi:NADH:ubiquinone oxidoreductase subunit 5 (subunit L)/multisubunit Na+/H+ antiporter MnhA subunit